MEPDSRTRAILDLQRKVGNRALGPLLDTEGDAWEREAEKVATEVADVSIDREGSTDAAGRTRPLTESGVRRPDRGNGDTFPLPMRTFFEPHLGRDLSSVTIRTDQEAARFARDLNADALTVGNEIFFGPGRFQPATSSGRRLLAHELTHVVQQERGGRAASTPRVSADAHSSTSTCWGVSVRSSAGPVPAVQRQAQGAAAPARRQDPLTRPLDAREWEMVALWQSLGEVGVDPLTDDAAHNALVVAEGIFLHRWIGSPGWTSGNEDPLLGVDPDVTRADPRVRAIAREVTARGPIINWASVTGDNRILHVMNLLVDQYGFPVNGAAGLVGNLWAESGVLPNRIEGSRPATPMTAPDFAGNRTEFTAEEVMNRNRANRQGPRLPGIGLAQWTTPARRTGLFQHQVQGRRQGAAILFDMDAQVDYLVTELQNRFAGVYNTLTNAGVSLNDAADDVVYRFEIPGAILDAQGNRLPRNDGAVQAVFGRRRAAAQRALRVYRAAHPQPNP